MMLFFVESLEEDLGFANFLILLGMFTVVFIITVAKAIPCIIHIKARYNSKILWFDIIIAISISCIVYLVRIGWCLNFFLGKSLEVFVLLGFFCTATFNVLGYTFIMFWIETYIDINLNISDYSRQKKRKTIYLSYIILSLLTYSLCLIFMHSSEINYYYFTILFYINCAISLIVSLCLVLSSNYLTKQFSVLFPETLFKKINTKVKKILVSNIFIYISKGIIFIAINCVDYVTSAVFKTVYYYTYMIVTEIIPLCAVLYFLRANKEKNHYDYSNIPSALISSEKNEDRIKEIFGTFMAQSTFDCSDWLKSSCLSSPLGLLSEIEQKINNSNSFA
ncbi:hypothetical protein SteCoe_1838 [Stentor coeruleus]|uniref:THH1/TOM1/TOM3 domain-containing protein n=1 Tax=Stentor coeruleus TaxID=5963 RepID=A0A1R2D156_9CILI|nr:hypothetical protein SteCoe_1838 [Stentor coeruleus]